MKRIVGFILIATTQAVAFDCTPIVSYYVSFDPAVALKISKKQPITTALAEDQYYLQYEMQGQLELLSPEKRDHCLRQARATESALVDYLKKRLRYLLASDELDAFAIEYQNLLAVRISVKREAQLVKLLPGLESEYLVAVKRRLDRELVSTHWAAYASLPISLESWGEEWGVILGREAPAAVQLKSGRVVLRPAKYSPDVLAVFLFHELAHLSRTFSSEYESELYAWQNTMDFLNSRKARGAQVPPFFVKIHENIRVLGLEAWVRSVIDSRRRRGQPIQ